jgi:WD40 repeat protein
MGSVSRIEGAKPEVGLTKLLSPRWVEPLKGHTENVWSAAFNPDGKRIVTASDDKTARLWDAATGNKSASRLRDSAARPGNRPASSRVICFRGS